MSEEEENKPVDSPAENEDDGMISLDDIDSIIAESDPEFDESMQDLKESETQEDNSADAQATEEEVEVKLAFAERYPRFYSKVVEPFKLLIAHPVKLFSIVFEKIKPLFQKSKEASIRFAKATKAFSIWFLKEGVPKYIKHTKELLAKIVASIKAMGVALKELPLIKKVALFSFVLLLFSTLWAFKKTLKGIWVPFLKSDIVYDISKFSSEKKEIALGSEWVLIHDAFPQPEYSFLLDKFVVNLKRTGVGNPMVAMQLFITLDAQEAAIEIKDREREVLDLAQRITEGFTYAEINEQTGLYRYKTQIRNELNRLLNTGRVKNVLIKHRIPKPP